MSRFDLTIFQQHAIIDVLNRRVTRNHVLWALESRVRNLEKAIERNDADDRPIDDADDPPIASVSDSWREQIADCRRLIGAIQTRS